MTDELKALLWEILEYMEDRQDCEILQSGYHPNQEMKFAVQLREQLGVRDKQ